MFHILLWWCSKLQFEFQFPRVSRKKVGFAARCHDSYHDHDHVMIEHRYVNPWQPKRCRRVGIPELIGKTSISLSLSICVCIYIYNVYTSIYLSILSYPTVSINQSIYHYTNPARPLSLRRHPRRSSPRPRFFFSARSPLLPIWNWFMITITN